MRLKNHGCEELNQEHAQDIATVWCTTARHSAMLHRSVTSTISPSFQLGQMNLCPPIFSGPRFRSALARCGRAPRSKERRDAEKPYPVMGVDDIAALSKGPSAPDPPPFHQWRVIPSGTSEKGSVRTFFPSLSITNIVQADHLWPSIPVLLNINSRATTKAWLMAAFLSSSTVPYGSVTQRLFDRWK
jgi:hypothetical protein